MSINYLKNKLFEIHLYQVSVNTVRFYLLFSLFNKFVVTLLLLFYIKLKIKGQLDTTFATINII